MPAPAEFLPNGYAVVDASGAHIMWADHEYSQALLKAKEVALLRRRRRPSVLVVVAVRPKPGEARLLGRGNGLHRTRYVNKRETESNPPNVWALTRLVTGTQGAFLRVVTDCIAVA